MNGDVNFQRWPIVQVLARDGVDVRDMGREGVGGEVLYRFIAHLSNEVACLNIFEFN